MAAAFVAPALGFCVATFAATSVAVTASAPVRRPRTMTVSPTLSVPKLSACAFVPKRVFASMVTVIGSPFASAVPENESVLSDLMVTRKVSARLASPAALPVAAEVGNAVAPAPVDEASAEEPEEPKASHAPSPNTHTTSTAPAKISAERVRAPRSLDPGGVGRGCGETKAVPGLTVYSGGKMYAPCVSCSARSSRRRARKASNCAVGSEPGSAPYPAPHSGVPGNSASGKLAALGRLAAVLDRHPDHPPVRPHRGSVHPKRCKDRVRSRRRPHAERIPAGGKPLARAARLCQPRQFAPFPPALALY